MFTRCNIKHHNWCFWTVVLKTLESLLDCKEIKAVNPKGNRSWIFIGRTDAEAETPILWLPDAKNWLIWKDPDAGKDWRREEKGITEDEMVGWHYQLDGHEFEQAQGVGDGQGGLTCCSPWGRRVGHDWEIELNWSHICVECVQHPEGQTEKSEPGLFKAQVPKPTHADVSKQGDSITRLQLALSIPGVCWGWGRAPASPPRCSLYCSRCQALAWGFFIGSKIWIQQK